MAGMKTTSEGDVSSRMPQLMNSTSQRLFTCFPLLPKELRNCVIKHCCQEPSTIRLQLRWGRISFIICTKIPNILQVNHEIRHEALKFYKLWVTAVQEGANSTKRDVQVVGVTYINPQIDTLVVQLPPFHSWNSALYRNWLMNAIKYIPVIETFPFLPPTIGNGSVSIFSTAVNYPSTGTPLLIFKNVDQFSKNEKGDSLKLSKETLKKELQKLDVLDPSLEDMTFWHEEEEEEEDTEDSEDSQDSEVSEKSEDGECWDKLDIASVLFNTWVNICGIPLEPLEPGVTNNGTNKGVEYKYGLNFQPRTLDLAQ